MIEARHVTVHAGRAVLVEDISLDVAEGELVAIVGPNGAGKSTLLGAMTGDRPVTGGSIRLAGRALAAMDIPELASRRAVLPQRAQLALPFTTREVVQLAGATVGRALAERCLADVELDALADRLYTTLSGGEQQRVQLARVLAQLAGAPGAALFLDEPTAALDPRHARIVLQLARRAASEHRAVVIVLHDLTLAARWADRVALLRGGRLAALGPPSTVLTPSTLADTYRTPFEVTRTDGGLVIAPA